MEGDCSGFDGLIETNAFRGSSCGGFWSIDFIDRSQKLRRLCRSAQRSLQQALPLLCEHLIDEVVHAPCRQPHSSFPFFNSA